MATGEVDFFKESGGYGFIETADADEDVAFHTEDIGWVDLEEGQEVEFDIAQADKGSRAETLTRLRVAAGPWLARPAAATVRRLSTRWIARPMPAALDAELRRRTWELLQPGDIELDGLVLHTGFDGSQEPEMHQATVEVGDLIAAHAGYDPADTFVYSGTDDAEFASNQHQGRTLEDESFVWECQQLLRDGAFDVVFYFERIGDLDGLVGAVREAGFDATAVPGDDAPERSG